MHKHGTFLASLFVLSLSLPITSAAQHHDDLQPPSSIRTEHERIHEHLSKVIRLGGETGKAGQEVADALHEHFRAEEQFALPQLGSLEAAAMDRTPAHSRELIEMSERLEKELPVMLREHRAIVDKLTTLKQAGLRESQPLAVEFAEELEQHAMSEEQILYPASILLGKYLEHREKDDRREDSHRHVK